MYEVYKRNFLIRINIQIWNGDHSYSTSQLYKSIIAIIINDKLKFFVNKTIKLLNNDYYYDKFFVIKF